MLIAFEGIDGSGKSSQAGELARMCRSYGKSVAETAHAERPIRRLYKQLIAQESTFPEALPSLLLSLADYISSVSEALRLSEIVICERFMYSALADGVACGLPDSIVSSFIPLFMVPDLTVYVDVEPEVALLRKGGRASLAEAGGPADVRSNGSTEVAFLHYQQRVRAAYESIFRHLPQGTMIKVDGRVDCDKVTEQWMFAVESLLRRKPFLSERVRPL